MIKKGLFFGLALSVIAQVQPVHAQVKDQVFKDWTAYSATLDGKKMCYIASFPTKKTGNYKLRDEPFFIVTNVDTTTDEVSVSSGYDYKENSKVKITVNDNSVFHLSLVQGERAWAKSGDVDKKLIETMRAKNSIEVKGISSKGTYSVDTYSLSGFTAAYQRMKELCK